MGTGATASESSGSVADYTDDDGVADTDGQTEPDRGDLTVYENTIAGYEQGDRRNRLPGNALRARKLLGRRYRTGRRRSGRW